MRGYPKHYLSNKIKGNKLGKKKMICWGYFISRREGQGEEINDVTVWITIIPTSTFYNCAFLFFFFFCSAAIVDFVNGEQCIRTLFTVLQIILFNNFFIKNRSHSTIYTFKNYFTIMFLVLVFSFNKNKFNPNTSGIYVCMKSQFLLPTVYDFLVKEIRKSIVPHKVLLLFLYHFMGHLMGIHILCFKSRQTTPFYQCIQAYSRENEE